MVLQCLVLKVVGSAEHERSLSFVSDVSCCQGCVPPIWGVPSVYRRGLEGSCLNESWMIGDAASLLGDGIPHSFKAFFVFFVGFIFLLEEHGDALDELDHAMRRLLVALPSAHYVSLLGKEINWILILV